VSGAALIKSELKNVQLKGAMEYVLFLFRMKVFMGFAVVFLSSLVLIKALSVAKISLVNPIATGINFCLTLFLGYFLFQEKLTLTHYIGMILILTGIVLIASVEQA
jgi:multidrug transporter EmrE-like cation transporter